MTSMKQKRRTYIAAAIASIFIGTISPAGASGTTTRSTLAHTVDEGHGPAVVLIPGWPLSGDTWKGTAADLVHRGFRVIRIDERGFGGSASMEGPYTYDAFASDLDAVLRVKKLTAVTLVGHSMGGAVAAHYAATLGRHRVKALVLVAAAGPAMVEQPDHPGGVPQSVFDGIIKGARDDRSGFLDGFSAAFFATPQSPEFLAAFKGDALRASSTATVDAITAVSKADLSAEIGMIRARTVVIHGTADKLVPFAQAAVWQAGIPGATVEAIDGAGHGVYIEASARVDDLIAAVAGQ